MNFIVETTDPCILSVLMPDLISVEYEENFGAFGSIVPYDWVELVLQMYSISCLLLTNMFQQIFRENCVSCSVIILLD